MGRMLCYSSENVMQELRKSTAAVLHKRIISSLITNMDESHAAYFGRVIDRLEQDPRTELYPNLPILILKETLNVLPIYLEPQVLVNHLFQFLEKEKDTVSKVIHDVHYVADNTVLAPYCAEFVENVIRDTLANVDDTEQETTGRSEYRLRWPISPEDFPYLDDDEIDKESDKEN